MHACMDRCASQPHLLPSTSSTFSTHSRNLVMLALQSKHNASTQIMALLPPHQLLALSCIRRRMIGISATVYTPLSVG